MINLEKFFYIESIQEIDFDYIKKTKACLVLKNIKRKKYNEYAKIINLCKKKQIIIYISNDVKLLALHRLKHFYISAYNKKFFLNFPKNIKIIGSAHNVQELEEKKKQGCKKIVFSRLFKTKKKGYLGIVKFNLVTRKYNNIIVLGGINSSNYKKIKMLACVGFALQSDLLKKPNYLLS